MVDTKSSGAGDPASAEYMRPFVTSPDGVLFTAPDGRIFAANPAACQLLGWDEEQICARGRLGVADLSDERWLAGAEQRHRVGHFRGDLRMRRADGSVFTVDLTSATFTVAGERRAYTFFRDASESMEVTARAEADARAAQRVVETLESITDGYYALDAEWNLTYVNRHAELLLGADRMAVLGRNLWEVFPTARGTEFDDQYQIAMSTRSSTTFEGFYEALNLHCEIRVYPLGSGGLAVYFMDIAARRAAQREHEQLLVAERTARVENDLARSELAHQVTHDDLTGLPNRAGLVDVCKAVEQDLEAAVLFVDLDRFKLVNDTLGHGAGDELLVALADRLRGLTGHGHTLARFGSDEFVFLLLSPHATEVSRLSEAVLKACGEPIRLVLGSMVLSASIGVASGRARDLETLLRNADTALHAAKDAGRNCAMSFTPDMRARSEHRLQIEAELRRSLDRGEFVLHYQPAFDLVGDSRDVEALIRWNHPTLGLIGPVQFIGIAEDSGLIDALGRWVIEEAVAQAQRWASVPGLRVWVNVSARQLALPGLADLLATTLRESGVSADRFGIELTESTLTDKAQLVDELQRISDLGVAIAIDDFGTGFSSLSRLAHLPVDVIKVDRSFIEAVGSTRGEALVASIIALSHSLGATVIAEGVEDESQLSAVVRLGCDRVAGYLLARPAPAAEVRWVASIKIPRRTPGLVPVFLAPKGGADSPRVE